MDPDEDQTPPPVVDINTLHRRQWRNMEWERRRRVRRQKIIGLVGGVALALAVAWGAYAWLGGGSSTSAAPSDAPAPVRVDIGPPPADTATTADSSAGTGVYESPDETVRNGSTVTAPSGSGTSPGSLKDQAAAAAAGAGAVGAGAGAASASTGTKPVVWIQSGHVDPREPGYKDQTGAGSGPFGSEIGLTTRLAPKVIARLKAAGVDARYTPGLVTPLGSQGAAFVSLHSDVPEGAAAIGHAITGANENYYHGEGSGTASPTPYADSAPHRPATKVSAAVEQRSRDLANRVSRRYGRIYSSANGARARFTGVQPRSGNPRMMKYYGYYRTNAGARMLIETGAGGTDDAFLAKTDLIAGAISQGILDYLRARGLLSR